MKVFIISTKSYPLNVVRRLVRKVISVVVPGIEIVPSRLRIYAGERISGSGAD